MDFNDNTSLNNWNKTLVEPAVIKFVISSSGLIDQPAE
jgi:hypothetical protein